MNEFDARQLNIMLQKIHAFSQGALDFPDLIYDLEALVNILVGVLLRQLKSKYFGNWSLFEAI